MEKLVFSTALKNAIAREAKGEMRLSTSTIRNIVVNGQKRGCSGFVRNMGNGAVIYVNTEPVTLSTIPPFMCRYAYNEKDHTGYRNRFAWTLDELVKEIVDMARTPACEANDMHF